MTIGQILRGRYSSAHTKRTFPGQSGQSNVSRTITVVPNLAAR